jgi:hypothetical protein
MFHAYLTQHATAGLMPRSRNTATIRAMHHDFWTFCGFDGLQRSASGTLQPTDTYWRWLLARPELALLPESCPAERRLHGALQESPSKAVNPEALKAFKDPDARESYTYFLRFRDGVVQAGTLEAYYAKLFRSGSINIPPLFIDLMVQAIVRNILADEPDALVLRAAELLFRPQRVTLADGRIISGDQEALDNAQETGGVGDLGRLLMQNKVQLTDAHMQVLSAENAVQFWQSVCKPSYGHRWLLDLTHEVSSQVGQGQHMFTVQLARSDSGLKALARVLELWINHFHAVQVRIKPLAKVDDPAWRWHIGLDAESTSLLNDLYNQQTIDEQRMQRLISLFRLEFADPAEMRADLAGKPVYLGLAMAQDGLLRVKPQNLLLNLPLAVAS